MKLEILFFLWQNFMLQERSRALKIVELSREDYTAHCALQCECMEVCFALYI